MYHYNFITYYSGIIRDSSFSKVVDYGLDDRLSIPSRDRVFFSSPPRPYCLWSPLSRLLNGRRGSEAT